MWLLLLLWMTLNEWLVCSAYDQLKFRSKMKSNAKLEAEMEIEALLAQRQKLNSAIQRVNNIYQDITDASDISTSVRRKIASNKYGQGVMMNQLIADRHMYRDQQQEMLQRIQQLFYQLRRSKRKDSFCEENLPLEDFAYRWMTIDDPLLPKNTPDLKPLWGFEGRPLEVGQLSACSASILGSSIKEPTIAQRSESGSNAPVVTTTWIKQTNAKYRTTGDKPQTFMVVRGRTYDDGYIVTNLKFPREEATGPSAAGVVFKYQNTNEFGYVTVSVNSLTPIQGAELVPATLNMGHVNNGHSIVFRPTTLMIDPQKWTLLGVRFSPDGLKVFVNGLFESEKRFTGPWRDGGSCGLFALHGKLIFSQFTTGPHGTEEAKGPLVAKALGGLDGAGSSLTAPMNKDEYAMFVKKAEERRSEAEAKAASTNLAGPQGGATPGSTTTGTGTPGTNTPGGAVSGPLCYDYSKVVPTLDDWTDAAALGWILESSYGTKRITTIQTMSLESTNRALLLKNFACDSATSFVRVRLEPESEAGIVFEDRGVTNRYLASIDSGFSTVQLSHYTQGYPQPLQVAAMPDAKDNMLHSLRVKIDKKKNLITVHFNGRKTIEYSPGVGEARGEALLPGQAGGYGLYIGRGNAEFSEFKVSNVVKLPNQP